VDPFYAVVRVIARFWIWFFFERVEVRHPERNVPNLRRSPEGDHLGSAEVTTRRTNSK
jgi:hypothetical protein